MKGRKEKKEKKKGRIEGNKEIKKEMEEPH